LAVWEKSPDAGRGGGGIRKGWLMMRCILLGLVCGLVLAGCSRSSDGDGSARDDGTGDKQSRLQRRVIDKLTPRVYIELAIDFAAEQRLWQEEWQGFIRKKKIEYFKAFGINEEEFNEYGSKNFKAWNTFLERNPEYKTRLNEVVQQQQRYTQ
jgi:hypothetical protein